MPFSITFNNETKTYEKPLSILDVVGPSKEYVCAYVNGRVRELTYILDKDATVTPLTCKDRDARPSYEASLRYLVAMAMHNLHPDFDIRLSYNVSRSVFMQILNQGATSNVQIAKELEKEMKRLVDLDLPLVRSIVSKEEAQSILTQMGGNVLAKVVIIALYTKNLTPATSQKILILGFVASFICGNQKKRCIFVH